jgi:hypothetical protein
MNNTFNEWWKNATDAQKVDLWNSSGDKKKGLCNLFNDSQRVELWGILDSLKLDFQKIELWNVMSNIQKANFLEILSRDYSLADMIFAARKIVDDRVKEQKNLQCTSVNISLEVTDLIKEFGEEKGNEFGAKKALVDANIKNLTSHITITCDIGGGIAEYEDDGSISKTSARCLVGHEIGHIILHPDDVINGKRNTKLTGRYEETKANFFARIISDLRDLYILQCNGDINPNIIGAEDAIADSYREEMAQENDKHEKVKPEDIDIILKSALDLNEKSKAFIVSSTIFAAKIVINKIYTQHTISKLFPYTKGEDDVKIHPIPADSDGLAGYIITIPERRIPRVNSYKITRGIGALLLCYDMIKDEKSTVIHINKNIFSTKWKDIDEFSYRLSRAKADHLKKVFVPSIKSKQRIMKIIGAK